MKFFTYGALSVLIGLSVYACSSTGGAAAGGGAGNSLFPSWYNANEYSVDSLSYAGFGTAIAGDSLLALQRAEADARVNLETYIAELTEEIREEMIDAGSNDAANIDFIIILRMAHSLVEGEAAAATTVSRAEGSYYRGFAGVKITREELVKVLERGFTGHPRYWGGFSSSALFTEYFK